MGSSRRFFLGGKQSLAQFFLISLLIAFYTLGDFALAAEVRAEPTSPPPIILAGSAASLSEALVRLLGELNSPQETLPPESIDFSIRLLTAEKPSEMVGETSVHSHQHLAALFSDTEARTRFESLHRALEDGLRRNIPITTQVITADELAQMNAEVEESARIISHRLRTAREGSASSSERFVGINALFWESVSNPANLTKAVVRFVVNTTLVGISLVANGESALPVSTAAWLGVAAGSGSFILMSGNDLYKAFLASPYWLSIPTQAHLAQLNQENQASPNKLKYQEWRLLAMGWVKDLFVAAGYLIYFQGWAYSLGEAPESWSKGLTDFGISLGLTLATETNLTLLNGQLTRRAIEKLPSSDSSTPGKERNYRNRSASVALIQSAVMTVFQILAAMGHEGAQLSLGALSGVGTATYYVLVIAKPESYWGRVRENYVLPKLAGFADRSEAQFARAKSAVVGLCQTVASHFAK